MLFLNENENICKMAALSVMPEVAIDFVILSRIANFYYRIRFYEEFPLHFVQDSPYLFSTVTEVFKCLYLIFAL